MNSTVIKIALYLAIRTSFISIFATQKYQLPIKWFKNYKTLFYEVLWLLINDHRYIIEICWLIPTLWWWFSRLMCIVWHKNGQPMHFKGVLHSVRRTPVPNPGPELRLRVPNSVRPIIAHHAIFRYHSIRQLAYCSRTSDFGLPHVLRVPISYFPFAIVSARQ